MTIRHKSNLFVFGLIATSSSQGLAVSASPTSARSRRGRPDNIAPGSLTLTSVIERVRMCPALSRNLITFVIMTISATHSVPSEKYETDLNAP